MSVVACGGVEVSISAHSNDLLNLYHKQTTAPAAVVKLIAAVAVHEQA